MKGMLALLIFNFIGLIFTSIKLSRTNNGFDGFLVGVGVSTAIFLSLALFTGKLIL